jgi:hypothetical protein
MLPSLFHSLVEKLDCVKHMDKEELPATGSKLSDIRGEFNLIGFTRGGWAQWSFQQH